MDKILLLIAFASIHSCTSFESDSMADLEYAKDTFIYFLDYYYQETPEDIIWTVGTKRIFKEDGSFCLNNYSVEDTINFQYQTCYSASGIPLGSGDPGKFYKVTEDSYELNFAQKDTSITIKSNMLKDESKLWFWKVKPNMNDTLTVLTINKNFINMSIGTKATYKSFQAMDLFDLNGKQIKAYRVKSWSEGSDPSVYDIEWFDERGMLIQQHHVVGNDGIRIAKLASHRD